MGVLRLAVCVSGVYATFLLWAIAQERRESFASPPGSSTSILISVVSVPFPSTRSSKLQHAEGLQHGDKFPSPVFLTFAQATASSICAAVYLLFSAWRDGSLKSRTIGSVLGLSHISASIRDAKSTPKANVEKDGKTSQTQNDTVSWRKTLPALLAQVALFQTTASPIGFLALEHISYPTMVLGKVRAPDLDSADSSLASLSLLCCSMSSSTAVASRHTSTSL